MLGQLRICLTQSLLVRTHLFLIPQFVQTTSRSTPMKYQSCWITWSFTACDAMVEATERVPGGCVAWASKLLRCNLPTFCSCNKRAWEKCAKVWRVRSSRTWSTNLEKLNIFQLFRGFNSRLLHFFCENSWFSSPLGTKSISSLQTLQHSPKIAGRSHDRRPWLPNDEDLFQKLGGGISCHFGSYLNVDQPADMCQAFWAKL